MKAGRPMRVAFNAPPERRDCSAQGEASDADMALREIVGKLVETANNLDETTRSFIEELRPISRGTHIERGVEFTGKELQGCSEVAAGILTAILMMQNIRQAILDAAARINL